MGTNRNAAAIDHPRNGGGTAEYLFNNNLAFLWPRSAPDSPSKTGSCSLTSAAAKAPRLFFYTLQSSYCQYAQMVAELGADGNKTVRG